MFQIHTLQQQVREMESAAPAPPDSAPAGSLGEVPLDASQLTAEVEKLKSEASFNQCNYEGGGGGGHIGFLGELAASAALHHNCKSI